jgi:hypothetical protein
VIVCLKRRSKQTFQRRHELISDVPSALSGSKVLCVLRVAHAPVYGI